MELYIIPRLIYFFICFLQPIILPIPEPVTIMAGSSAFGAVEGALIGFLGTIFGIITMFFIGRFASEKFISRLVSDKSVEKFNRYREKHENLVILGLFILPVLPDEIICIAGGLAKINIYKFIIIATISKVITSISLAFSIKLVNITLSEIIFILIIMMGFIVCIKLISKYILKRQTNRC